MFFSPIGRPDAFVLLATSWPGPEWQTRGRKLSFGVRSELTELHFKFFDSRYTSLPSYWARSVITPYSLPFERRWVTWYTLWVHAMSSISTSDMHTHTPPPLSLSLMLVCKVTGKAQSSSTFFFHYNHTNLSGTEKSSSRLCQTFIRWTRKGSFKNGWRYRIRGVPFLSKYIYWHPTVPLPIGRKKPSRNGFFYFHQKIEW